VREARKLLNVSEEMLKRPLNVGFRAREKAQRSAANGTLKPALAILDETDSGLDIDA